jgi:chemotaxis protein methyltransferase CheR
VSDALREVARIVHLESGIELKPAQWGALEAAIARVERGLTAEGLLQRTGCLTPAGQLPSAGQQHTAGKQRAKGQQPTGSRETLRRLIDEVTIRETFFFRHPAELEAIDWHVLLQAARARGSETVRVWVAGCASGEEAYTLAILACEAFSQHSPPVEILASDIAQIAIDQARQGSYRERAARNVAPALRERYFSSAAGMLTIGPRLRSLVRVRSHNLVGDAIPPLGEQRFDVILCRNVLIYFDRRTVERVIGALELALVTDGLLLLGAADRLSGQSVVAPGKAKSRPAKSAPATARPESGQAKSRPAKPGPAKSGRAEPHAPKPGPVAKHNSVASPPGSVAEDALDDPQRPLERALRAADRGDLDMALSATQDALRMDPLNAEAYFIQGVAELSREHPGVAVEPLRRALYIDPNHSLAAFNLARAHDALGEHSAARRAYERTLRTLDQESPGDASASDQLERLDIAAACHARLRELTR